MRRSPILISSLTLATCCFAAPLIRATEDYGIASPNALVSTSIEERHETVRQPDTSTNSFGQIGDRPEVPIVDEVPSMNKALIGEFESDISEEPDDALQTIDRKVTLACYHKSLEDYERLQTQLGYAILATAIGPIEDGMTEEQIAEFIARQQRVTERLNQATQKLRTHIQHLESGPIVGRYLKKRANAVGNGRMTKVFLLTNSEAKDVVDLIEALGEAKAVAHSQRNAVIVNSDSASLTAIEAIVRRVDQFGEGDDTASTEITNMKVFSLAHSKAQDIVSVVEKLVAVKAAAYQPSNVVIANGDAETLAIVEAIVSRLDQPVTNHKVPSAEQTP